MPEGVVAYRRWGGQVETGPRWPVLVAHELRLAWHGRWSLLAVAAGLAWGLASVIELVQGRDVADAAWVLDAYTAMLHQLRWAAVAAAVVIGAPMVLEDLRSGALELYLTRGLTRHTYLLGKAAALLILTTATMALPALMYYAASLAFYDAMPASWHLHAAYGLIYSLLWGLLVSGIALGASCALRSTAGAVLTVAGIFAGLDIVVRRLIGALTENPKIAVASPFAAAEQASTWLWPGPPPFEFPALWGFAAWLALTLLGWGLAIARNPHPRGDVHGE